MAKIVPFIQFDFRDYVPDQNLSSGTVTLDGTDCISNSLAVTLKAQNLIPGHIYEAKYEFLNPDSNPTTNPQPFNPSLSNLYASYSSQNFATTVSLPSKGEYVFKATITDKTEGTNSGASGSTQILLKCAVTTVSFSVEIIDPDGPSPSDNIINIDNCSNSFPLIGLIKNTDIGRPYEYTFYDNPPNSINFEKKTGTVFAGDSIQNFNSKISLTGSPYAYVYADVQEIDTGIIKTSEPVLLKCFNTSPCDVQLPTGVNVTYNALTMKECKAMGCTTSSLVKLNGGSNFAVGDKVAFGGGDKPCIVQINKVGLGYESINTFGGGSGIKIGSLFTVGGGSILEVVSVGLTKNSINSLNGCSSFKIGDLLTTVGGGGKDAIIKVVSTGVNGSIGSYDVLNPGYGYIAAPTGVRNLTGVGGCASASFNMDNGTIPFGGGLTNDSFTMSGGSGYQLNEVLDINGVGGSGAKVQVIALSLTNCSISSLSGGSGYASGDYITTSGCGGKDAVIKITSVGLNGSIQNWQIINPGYDYTCVPTSIRSLTGNGVNASFVGSDCWALQSEKGITKESLIDLIGKGPGYTVGQKLYVDGGGCKGGVIQITKIDSVGTILDFVILDSGCCCIGIPIIRNEDGNAIVPQPIVNVNAFIKDPIVVINSGSGYGTANSPLIITDGSGNIVTGNITLNNDELIPKPGEVGGSVIITNPGSFPPPNSPIQPPVCLPSGSLSPCSGICCIQTDYDQPIRGPIACSGSITKASVTNLIGKSGNFNVKDIINIQSGAGGTGAGGQIIITRASGGIIQDFEVYQGGCYYTAPPEPLFYKADGSLITGVTVDSNLFTNSPITVIDPGDIKGDGCRSCCQTITGYGSCPPPEDVVFDNHLIPLDFAPTPPPTPTPTVTPSVSQLAQCDDIQSAGGQNTISSVDIKVTASSGQNYLVVENTNMLTLDSVIYTNGIVAGSYIKKIENWFSNNPNEDYKKITISNNITSVIPLNTVLTVYNVDTRLIKVPYWPGNMVFTYDAYTVPDRFKVIAIPLDTRQEEQILFDSKYRGGDLCGYADTLEGAGQGQVTLVKPDGCIFVKVIVEAPCEGTAWEYSLSCPQRIFTTVTSTPTTTPTITPTKTVTPTPSRPA